MKKILISVLVIIKIAAYAQAPSWSWAKSAGGIYVDYATSIAVDNSGNVFLFGSYGSHYLNFGSNTLTNVGPLGYNNHCPNDIFLVKYDCSGNVLWAISMGGTNRDFANSIAVDASGNIFITGYFDSPTLSFGNTTLTNAGGGGLFDMFLAKYDTNGNALWAKSAGSTGGDKSNSVAVDLAGNIYIGGWYNSSTINFDTISLSNTGLFLTKYDTNGNVLWAKCADAPNGGIINSIAVDAGGNIWATGQFTNSTIIFGSTILTNAGTSNILLLKFDTNGNVIWAKREGSINSDIATSITTDASGNGIISGYFQSPSISFDTITLFNTNSDIFLTKYDANGNVKWAKSPIGTNLDTPSAVASDILGDIYMAGKFYSPTLIFGSTTLINADNSTNTRDVFIAKYDSLGNPIWAKSCGGMELDDATSIAVNNLNNIYLAGWFYSSTINFDTISLVNIDYADIFIAEIGNCCAINTSISHTESCTGSNNGTATVVASGVSMPCTYLWNTIPLQTSNIAINLTPGTYSVTVSDANGCSAINSVIIGATPLPIVHAGNDTIVCGGIYNDVLTANGGVSYLWSYNNLNSQSIIVSTDTTSIYTVTVMNANGCIAFDSVIITVNPLPIANVIKDTTVCNGTKDTLFASGGISYLWSYNNLTSQNIIVSPNSTTTYTVTVTDINGCTASDNATITVDTLNFISISLISGGTVLSCDQLLPHYQWYFNGNLIAGAISQVYMPFVNGNYTVIGTDSFGCSVTSSPFNFTYVDVDDFKNNNSMSIFPNPANNTIIILIQNPAVVEISDIHGRLIKYIIISDKETNIDISDLLSGVYILKAKTDRVTVTKKLIKE